MPRHAPRNLQGLPTLTEVIDLPPPEGAANPAPVPAAASPASQPAVADAMPFVAPADEMELVDRVLLEMQRHVEPALEQRLLEVIEPALRRASETLVRELRAELAATMHDVVVRAVGQELARRRIE